MPDDERLKIQARLTADEQAEFSRLKAKPLREHTDAERAEVMRLSGIVNACTAEEHAERMLQSRVELAQHKALTLWQADKRSAYKLGLALVEVRGLMKQLGRGEFTAWCKEHDLDGNRVQYVIRVAEGKIAEAQAKAKAAAEARAEEAAKALTNQDVQQGQWHNYAGGRRFTETQEEPKPKPPDPAVPFANEVLRGMKQFFGWCLEYANNPTEDGLLYIRSRMMVALNVLLQQTVRALGIEAPGKGTDEQLTQAAQAVQAAVSTYFDRLVVVARAQKPRQEQATQPTEEVVK